MRDTNGPDLEGIASQEAELSPDLQKTILDFKEAAGDLDPEKLFNVILSIVKDVYHDTGEQWNGEAVRDGGSEARKEMSDRLSSIIKDNLSDVVEHGGEKKISEDDEDFYKAVRDLMLELKTAITQESSGAKNIYKGLESIARTVFMGTGGGKNYEIDRDEGTHRKLDAMLDVGDIETAIDKINEQH